MQSPETAKKRQIPSKKIALAGVLLAAALILSLIESLIPPVIPAAPYAKIGFANIILIAVLLISGYRWCLLILIIKCVFTGIFSGNMFSVVYALPAGIIAYSVSALLFKLPKLGIVAVSALSSIIHNFIQVTIASMIIGRAVWLTAPYLLALGAVAGVGTGVIAFLMLKAVPEKLYSNLN